MAQYSVQFTLFPTSNIVTDASTNTWSCEADDLDGVNNFIDDLETFYNALFGVYPAIVRQNAHLFKAYDRADPQPRAPVIERLFNLAGAPSGNPCPPEVSLCLSFQGTRESGIPQSRRRGRVYIGPLDASTIAPTGRPTSALITTLANAGDALGAAAALDPTYSWGVFSTVDQALAYVTDGWVDDEFDTQRRRGREYTQRTVWPV